MYSASIRLSFCVALVALLAFPALGHAAKQPSSSAIQKDLKKPGVKKVEFWSVGTRKYDRLGLIYTFTRGVTVTKDYKKIDGVNILLSGYVTYHSKNGKQWNYQGFTVTENKFEGLPDPSVDEIKKLIATDMSKFYGYVGGAAKGPITEPVMAKDPKWEWDSPNRVNFRMKCSFEQSVSYTDLESVDQFVEVRLFRDDYKKPWNSFMTSWLKGKDKDGTEQRVVKSTRKVSSEQMRALPSWRDLNASKQAAAESAKLPKLALPVFDTQEKLFNHMNLMLHEGDQDKLRAFFLATLSERNFAANAPGVLSNEGEELITKAFHSAYGKGVKYATMYCKKPLIDEGRTKSARDRIYFQGVVKGVNGYAVFQQSKGGYVEGVRQPGAWKLSELFIGMKEDADTKEFIASFSDRKKLCPND